MGQMSLVDIVIIVVYFAIMAILGVVAWKRNKTSEDYFVAGKSLGTFSLAAMWLSSWIGGASIVGTSTNGYDYGVSGVWYVGILGSTISHIRRSFRADTTTAPEPLSSCAVFWPISAFSQASSSRWAACSAR